MNAPTAQFRAEYARHRAAEGRGFSGDALRSLPYLRTGPLARQWTVRARSFDAFLHRVVIPMGQRLSLAILDLGAGNGWLCHRVAQMGHRAFALDIRDDDVDGLGAAAELLRDAPRPFKCVAASFDDLPFDNATIDISVFNASLHYAQDLGRVLGEAARVTRPGGQVVILDSPFYRRDADGAAMVAEKRAQGRSRFGESAEVLLAPDFIEYLTRERLASALPRLTWRRRRVFYPLWYEARPLVALLQSRRAPSRFDLWTAQIS